MATITCINKRSCPSVKLPSQACPDTPYGPTCPRGTRTEVPSSLNPTGDTGLNQLSFAGGSTEGAPADVYGVVGSAVGWSLSDHRESDIKIVHDAPRSDSALGLSTELDTSLEAEVKRLSEDNKPTRISNPYAVLSDDDGDCLFSDSLRGKARTLVRWFKSHGLAISGDLPERVRCGELRQAVRSCFPAVSPMWELSFKTVQKIEKRVCDRCEPVALERLSAWKEARLRKVEIDEEHLARFSLAFDRNVPYGWDDRRRPFIPNGHATESFKRNVGGNWNKEELSEGFRTELVWSSGKPRVVTLYSSRNTSLLAPLHYSLHSYLSDMGWLLVGPPTEEAVRKLNGADFLSFDYSSATDNIKTAYVKAAVEVLKGKAKNLSDDELTALDIMSNLSLDGRVAGSGQPMGSMMSFPLLCLINKTTVDLSMNRLLESGSISFREWTSHRCLINGDDLLLREPRPGLGMRSIVAEEGNNIGLVVNLEKSMEDPSLGEINSTLFDECSLVKKFNAAAVWMDSGVSDVLGFAWQASIDLRGFKKIVRANAHILAKQEEKHLLSIPFMAQAICRKDAKIRRALTSAPAELRPVPKGVFTMADKPDDYCLTRDEENEIILNEIERLRPVALSRKKEKKFRTSAVRDAHSFSSLLRPTIGVSREVTLSCLAKGHFT
ncbi:RNA dependent RNA polymerase, partial [Plasmopara viticola lesion associated ourmia-like virus 82]